MSQFDEVQEAVDKAHENLLAAIQLLRKRPAELLIPRLDEFLAVEERPRSVEDSIRNIKRMAAGLDKESLACAETVGFTLLRAQGAVESAKMKTIGLMTKDLICWNEEINTAITTKNFDNVPKSDASRSAPEIQEINQSVLKIGIARSLLEQTYTDMIVGRLTLIAEFEEEFCSEKSTGEALRAMTWRDWSAVAFQPIMAKLDAAGLIAAMMKFRESVEVRISPKLGTNGGDTQTIQFLEQSLQDESVGMGEFERLASKIEAEAKKLSF